jgi:hypothetical protein
MQNVHPIFQQALAGIAPPADAKHWQAMCIQLRTELTQYDAPRPPKGQFAYTFQHPELGPLECHLEGESAAPECGWPARITLCEAYLRGIAITDRLTADEVDSIEIEAM